MKKITEVMAEGKRFHIVSKSQVKPDGQVVTVYCAVADEYLDANGCLTRTLNGIQMCASESLNSCINTVIASERMKKLVEGGMDQMEALKAVFNLQ